MKLFSHDHTLSFSSNGATIYFTHGGNKAGEPLLLLHGGFGSLEDFELIGEVLMNDYRLIAKDGRGQGQSTLGDQPLTYAGMKSDAENLLDHLQIEKAHVLGFSDGAMVAHLMAIEKPSKVNKLISIGGPWRKKDLDLIRDPLMKVTPENWKEKFPDSYELYNRLQKNIDFPKLVEQLINMWVDESPQSGYPEDRVKEIRCPMLIIRGDEDPVVSRESAFLLADAVEGSQLLNVPFGGHEIASEQLETVAKFLLDFLKK